MKYAVNLIILLICSMQCFAMQRETEDNKILPIVREYLVNVAAIKKQYEDLPAGCETSADLLKLHQLKVQVDRTLAGHKTTLDEQLKLLEAQSTTNQE